MVALYSSLADSSHGVFLLGFYWTLSTETTCSHAKSKVTALHYSQITRTFHTMKNMPLSRSHHWEQCYDTKSDETVCTLGKRNCLALWRSGSPTHAPISSVSRIMFLSRKPRHDRRDPSHWPRYTFYVHKVGTNIAARPRSLGRYSSLADWGHWVSKQDNVVRLHKLI
jgi:hypothetical protein